VASGQIASPSSSPVEHETSARQRTDERVGMELQFPAMTFSGVCATGPRCFGNVHDGLKVGVMMSVIFTRGVATV
jgi:hypothetical protein